MENFFENPQTLLRFRRCSLGSYIKSFIKQLIDQGYARYTVSRYLRLIADFTCWLEKRCVTVEEITPEHIKQFFKQRQRPFRRGSAFALQRFLGFLRQQGIIPEKTEPAVQSPAELLADEFRSYLRRERALADRTIVLYLGFVGRFLNDRFADSEVDLSVLCAADVVAFVERQAAGLHPKHAKIMTTALRSFLQYARYRGDIKLDLAAAVPAVANWARASIPRFLSPDQVEQVLARCCNRQTAIGRRDYAILLLLARLGLRGGEVAALTLDDIDWESGYLTVCGKGGRRTTLPLPVDAGEAIAAYLKNGRPITANRHLFLRGQAPAVGFRGTGAISSLVRQALKRAEIDLPHKGAAHLFRHGLATQLLGRGASLAEIGELLRHQSPETTMIYAKVDLGSLRPLALPWPGGVL